MAKVTVTVCDQCGTQEDVLHYEVKQGTRKGGTDLCVTHNGGLEALLDGAAKKPAAKRAPRTSRTRRVMSMEEIEKLKNQGK